MKLSKMKDGRYSVEVVSWENDWDNVQTKYVHDLSLEDAELAVYILDTLFRVNSEYSNMAVTACTDRYNKLYEEFNRICLNTGFDYDDCLTDFLEDYGLCSIDFDVRVVESVKIYQLLGEIVEV